MSTTLDLSLAQWVKSTYSNADGGSCVEWAPKVAVASGIVPVRDSKVPSGPSLMFATAGWSTFVTAVNDGGFPAA
ncbi:DUF397 domain-containing protein [Streptomyces sp. NPDC058280]|uniref:DUF397 domain-containing protein n=1 Tax=Streptomyces sp. NPDC058280 TaxID=3346419 RepID=UPI0036EC1442